MITNETVEQRRVPRAVAGLPAGACGSDGLQLVRVWCEGQKSVYAQNCLPRRLPQVKPTSSVGGGQRGEVLSDGTYSKERQY